jgi:hypothetical protein
LIGRDLALRFVLLLGRAGRVLDLALDRLGLLRRRHGRREAEEEEERGRAP